MKNWYRGAELPQKEGLGQFTNLRGWLGKKEGDGAFEGRGGSDTPMKTMLI